MTPRTKIALLGCALALTLATLTWRRAGNPPESSQIQRPAAAAQRGRDLRGRDRAVVEALRAKKPDAATPALTRGEAAQRVRSLYRQEQLTRELALEQRRYGRNYWDAPPGGVARQVQRERDAMLAELSAEATQVLRDFFPDEAGEPVVLEAFFNSDRPAPNLVFLPPGQRARFEAELLADAKGACDAQCLERIAERVLAADEVELYRRWNAPAAGVLRQQLVGFNPTEAEFAALLHARNSIATNAPEPEFSELAAALGAGRFAALQKLQEPALQTALGDLHRLGLPLEQAEWLAATRTRVATEIGEIWRSTIIGDLTKRERVAAAERAYGQAVAGQLGLPHATLDGLTPDL